MVRLDPRRQRMRCRTVPARGSQSRSRICRSCAARVGSAWCAAGRGGPRWSSSSTTDRSTRAPSCRPSRPADAWVRRARKRDPASRPECTGGAHRQTGRGEAGGARRRAPPHQPGCARAWIDLALADAIQDQEPGLSFKLLVPWRSCSPNTAGCATSPRSSGSSSLGPMPSNRSRSRVPSGLLGALSSCKALRSVSPTSSSVLRPCRPASLQPSHDVVLQVRVIR